MKIFFLSKITTDSKTYLQKFVIVIVTVLFLFWYVKYFRRSGLSLRPTQSLSCRQTCRQINLSVRLVSDAICFASVKKRYNQANIAFVKICVFIKCIIGKTDCYWRFYSIWMSLQVRKYKRQNNFEHVLFLLLINSNNFFFFFFLKKMDNSKKTTVKLCTLQTLNLTYIGYKGKLKELFIFTKYVIRKIIC